MVSGTNYHLVRSCRQIPFEKDVIGVGWDDHNFSDYADVEELIKAIDKDYGIGRRANQVRRFKGIKKGDIILVPTWGAVAIARAEDEETYDPGTYYLGSNQRRVTFFMDRNGKVILVPRSQLATRLQARCKIRQTIADIGVFATDIEKIVTQLEDGHAYTWDSDVLSATEQHAETAKGKLLANIREGRTNLGGGGVGLEKLVKELLTIDGFDANILDKKCFPDFADADIEATRTNYLGDDESFLIQVKHHDGHTGDWGIEQLDRIKDVFPEKFPDHRLVLITSGKISSKVQEHASVKDVGTVDGEALVEWLFPKVGLLSPDTRVRLGLIDVPHIHDTDG